ncbi:MAG: lipoate--protein ligase family protein [Pirellulaceae bacterium]
MLRIDLTLPTSAENLAIDELLSDLSDSAGSPRECLRIWENPEFAVVLGRSSRHREEVNMDWCDAEQIPVLRRSSGGAAVVIGPGCLMYSVTLDYRLRPELRLLDQAHQFVMGRLVDAFAGAEMAVEFHGTCDLTWQGRKFSGNSLRCRRNSLLYHGTLLYDFSLSFVTECLGTPPRQPEYRRQRPHSEFVTNLPVTRDQLVSVLQNAWPTTGTEEPLNVGDIGRLAEDKYSDPAWTGKL